MADHEKLAEVIRILVPFCKHDPQCPWFGHELGQRNESESGNYYPRPCPPCTCGLQKQFDRIDRLIEE